MIGKTFRNYQVLEKIGEGGMGVVYKAKDTALNRTVVLKFLSNGNVPDSASKDRFMQEARAAAALNHPNIITVYEINELEDRMYIAMEFVEGETLQQKFIKPAAEEGKRIKTEEIIDIAIQVCDGLSRAHEKDIIHRDIKPQNIMITGDNRVKILDFGTAKLKRVKKITREFSLLGTIYYMSPEQISYKEIDQRTDIWALGVVLYELVTGHLPFEGDSAQSIFHSILNRDPEPICKTSPGSPVELEHIIMKALQKERVKRYADIDSMKIDLAAISSHLGPGTGTLTQVMPVSSGEESISIAVLPFVDLSPEKDQEYFCDGIAEEFINVLTGVGELKVASRTAAFQFKNKELSVEEIRDRINVRYILEGSVQKSDKRLRITTGLIDTADGCQVWSERFDREMKDIFAIQDEITMAVVENLKLKLLGNGKTELVKRHTYDQEAYNLYLNGRYFWNRRYKGGLNKSIEFYQLAIQKDPRYALPYVGIADSFNILGLYGFVPPGEAFTRARKAANKALEIENDLAEAFASLGWICTFYDWDWKEAEKMYRKAIELKSNYATAYEWYALSLATEGKLEEAIVMGKAALELDPLSLIINSVLGVIYIFAHKYDSAEEQFKKAIEMDPNFLLTHIWLGEIYLFKTRYDEAIDQFRKAAQISGDMTYALSNLGFTYAVSGQTAEAWGIIRKFEEIEKRGYVSLLQKAHVYVGLGEFDTAFELFEKAYQLRDPMCLWFNASPHFDCLQSHSRFNKLLKDIGLE